EEVGRADRLARLADEEQLPAIVRHDTHGAGVLDPLALNLSPVLVAERALADGEEAAGELAFGRDALEARAHGCSAQASRSAKATSSIPSSATTATRSLGSWLCSVPLARLTQAKPCASSAFASE